MDVPIRARLEVMQQRRSTRKEKSFKAESVATRKGGQGPTALLIPKIPVVPVRCSSAKKASRKTFADVESSEEEEEGEEGEEGEDQALFW